MYSRYPLWAVFILSVICTFGSFYAQYGMGVDPCVLCITQRVTIMLAGIVALLCILLPPYRHWLSYVIKTIICSVLPVYGMGVAIYQLYIQHMPMMEQPTCGAPWSFRLQDTPLFSWYEPIIRGSGNCGNIIRIFGISLPMWSALAFLIMLLCLWIGLWSKHHQSTSY